MVGERFSVLILTLVVGNVLFMLHVSCSTDITQLIVEENSEKEFPAEDGAWYDPNSTDIGPISPKIFEIQTNLTFLGNFNAKYWYIVRTTATLDQAVTNCTAMGMWIAEPNQAELNFLYSVTGSGDDRAWVGASFQTELSNFKWMSDGSTVNSSSLTNTNRFGLCFDRYAGDSKYYLVTATSARFYLCML